MLQTSPTDTEIIPSQIPTISPCVRKIQPESSARLCDPINVDPNVSGSDAQKERSRRKTKVPKRFEDFVIETIEDNMPGKQCPHCDKVFANSRNLSRHVNSKHDDNVKIICCSAGGFSTGGNIFIFTLDAHIT